ncbi:TolC family protein, partial [Bdellovibrionota bacterium]
VLSYQLWKWGRDLNTYLILKEQRELQEKQLTDDQKSIARSVQLAFYTVLLNQERLDIEEINLKQQKQQVEITEAKYRDGRLSKYDVLTVQVQLEKARSQLLSRKHDLEKSILELLTIMAEPLDSSIQVRGELKVSPVTETIDELVEIALNNRQDLMTVRSGKRVAQLTKRNNMTLFLPVLGVQVYYGFGSSPDPFVLPREDESFTVMSTLNVPLFDGFASYHKMRAAIADYYKNEVLEKKITQQVEND